MELKLPIYLDNNATTPCDPRVLEAMLPYFTQNFGNASSNVHMYGWAAQEAVDIAREQIASLINADPSEIIFTSGATESDNLAIKGVWEMYRNIKDHIISCATEHKAVLETCRHIEQLGGHVTYLPVDEKGLIDLEELEQAITPKTALIAIMYGNNETGVIQPIKEISNIARKHNILFFTDAAQAAGKIPVDVQADGIDLIALSAHKMYGSKGIGALYVRRKGPRVKLTPQMDGGGQERGIRSGTLNVPAIVGFGKACDICRTEMKTEATRLSGLRNKLEDALLQTGYAHINGDRDHRLPHVTNMSFEYDSMEHLIAGLQKDLAISSGSACSSASSEPSYVLKAMGLSDSMAYNSLRFGLGRFTTLEEVEYTINIIKDKLSFANPNHILNKALM